jgi:uncharacterized protein YqfA (UPF0365 family)
VKELSSSPLGSTLVMTIGNAFVENAIAELSTFDSISVGFQQAARGVGRGFSILSEGAQAVYYANNLSKKQKAKATQPDSVQLTAEEEEAMNQTIEKLSGHMFLVM